MTQPRRDGIDQHIFTEVPEADAAEQATPAIPGEDTFEETTREPPNEADPADAWEQDQALPDLDDDYDYQDREP
jgi:hypothetical protein